MHQVTDIYDGEKLIGTIAGDVPLEILGDEIDQARIGDFSRIVRDVFDPLPAWKFKAQLRIEGKYDTALAVIDALADPARSVVLEKFLNFSGDYLRTDPLFDQLGAGMGETPADIDAFWARAELLS